MSLTVTVPSMKEIEQLIKEKTASNNEFLLKEIEKLRNRMQDLESLFHIYNGKIKIE